MSTLATSSWRALSRPWCAFEDGSACPQQLQVNCDFNGDGHGAFLLQPHRHRRPRLRAWPAGATAGLLTIPRHADLKHPMTLAERTMQCKTVCSRACKDQADLGICSEDLDLRRVRSVRGRDEQRPARLKRQTSTTALPKRSVSSVPVHAVGLQRHRRRWRTLERLVGRHRPSGYEALRRRLPSPVMCRCTTRLGDTSRDRQPPQTRYWPRTPSPIWFVLAAATDSTVALVAS